MLFFVYHAYILWKKILNAKGEDVQKLPLFAPKLASKIHIFFITFKLQNHMVQLIFHKYKKNMCKNVKEK